ncbi:hypothetical protein [Erwinia phage vB_Ea277G]|nr:hypothetical protein [Erwinia phage vB_Ea277G]
MSTLQATAQQTPLQQLQELVDSGNKLIMLQNGSPVEFPLSLLTQVMGDAVTLEKLSAVDSTAMFGSVQSFADLRKLKPTANNVRVNLRGWNNGSDLGGGQFIGRIGVAKASMKKDDGGVIATSGTDWYWERAIGDINTLDVTHFGAVADGVTDSLPAVLAMFKWSQASGGFQAIQFPAGKFFLSQFEYLTEIARFRLNGTATNHFGYFNATTLTSDSNENVLFSLNARWVEISGFVFEGRTDIDGNKKGFYKNIIAGGQYTRISMMRWSKVGGTCVDMLDTLDSKIDQWYASGCTGDVIKGYWSGRAAGVWDHMTAVELSNFNVQNCRGGKVLNLPRCTQSFIWNGWIEHSDNPGDLSNGQWIINGLNIEDCKMSPLKLTFARIINFQLGLQSGSSVSYDVQDGDVEWLSQWERGHVDIDNHGIYIDGTIDAAIVGSRNKLSNSSDKAKWFCLGRFFTPSEGDQIDINMVGTGNFLSISTTMADIDDTRQGGGNTLIRYQAKKGAAGLSLMPMGSSPIKAVAYTSTSAGNITLYVQLKPYTRNVIPIITATGLTHFEAGVSVYWRPDRKALTDEEMAAIADVKPVVEQWSIGQLAGIGATQEGYLLVKSKVENGHLAVKVGNKIQYIQLKASPQ